jgi:hypothetical protein
MARLSRPPVIPASLPPDWGPLLTVMTARDPADRPTAAQVAQHLRGMQGGATTVLPSPTQAVRAPVERTTVLAQSRTVAEPPASSSKAAWWAAAFLVLGVVAAGVGYDLSRSKDQTPRQIPAIQPQFTSTVTDPLQSFVNQVTAP